MVIIGLAALATRLAACIATHAQTPVSHQTAVWRKWIPPNAWRAEETSHQRRQQHQRNLTGSPLLVARVVGRDAHKLGPQPLAIHRAGDAGRCPLALAVALDLDCGIRLEVEIPRGWAIFAEIRGDQIWRRPSV